MAAAIGVRTAAGPGARRHQATRGSRLTVSASASVDPLMVRTARGEDCERAPAWMMRQAGRYQKVYRDLALKHPSFRERSENVDLITEITLQPWNSFKPDGVILFSDILTPLPAFGVEMEIDDNKGPLIEDPLVHIDQMDKYHDIDFEKVKFVGESLGLLRKEVGDGAAVLGFVGSPWTLSCYVVEGKGSATYKLIKTMMHKDPELLDKLLSFVAAQIAEYAMYQIRSGAQVIQIFDSWGGQLPPHLWDKWSKPYIQKIVDTCKAEFPDVPLTLYANGSGGLLERMGTTGVDTIGLDWTIDMADARARLGADMTVQGNVDPAVLFADPDTITAAIKDCCNKAGTKGHVLNLGHGVLVGTPEENVKHFFDTNRAMLYAKAA